MERNLSSCRPGNKNPKDPGISSDLTKPYRYWDEMGWRVKGTLAGTAGSDRWIVKSFSRMNHKNAHTLLTGMIIGAVAGWLVKPAPQVARENISKEATGPGTKRSSRDDAAMLERGRVATRWIDRMEKDGVERVGEEIPTGDVRPLMEKMMTAMWGGMSGQQVGQLMFLMETWAEQDAEGALAWARGLDVSRQREIALTGVAVVIGNKDPMAGFEIYTEVGEVNVQIENGPLRPMMDEVYRLAAAKGVDALLEIVRRTPENKTRTLPRVSIDYPEGFDFARFIDGLATVNRTDGKVWLSRSFTPPDPLGRWALRDADAAFDHALTRTGEGRYASVDEMDREMAQKSGNTEAVRWMGDKLASLEPAQLAALLPRSGLLNSPGRLRGYAEIMPEAAAQEFRVQAIQASPYLIEILQDVPGMEERMAVIERLRGVKEPGFIRSAMNQWQVPQERIDKVMQAVTQTGE
jgi:hypothetical protein